MNEPPPFPGVSHHEVGDVDMSPLDRGGAVIDPGKLMSVRRSGRWLGFTMSWQAGCSLGPHPPRDPSTTFGAGAGGTACPAPASRTSAVAVMETTTSAMTAEKKPRGQFRRIVPPG
jgi:hypothetical protein